MSTPGTITDIFYSIIERDSPRVMMYRQTRQWLPISSRDLYRSVVGVARALESWGIRRGDRVGLLSENRMEWAVADFAIMAIGAVVVPIYPTQTAEQTSYMLRNCGARAVFVSTLDQFQKVLSIKAETALEKIAVMDYVADAEGIPMHRLMLEGPPARDSAFDTRARQTQPDDLATIIYTSGTTGTPKGAMLTHGNIASNVAHSLDGFDSGPSDTTISYLPLSHITARHVDYALLFRGVTLAYCPFLEDLNDALMQVRPTMFLAVPRVLEKIRNKVELEADGGMKRKIYRWTLRVGEQHKAEILEGKTPRSLRWKLANALVFSKVIKALGGRARVFICGGAPLGREVAEWYAQIGIRIFEGYGLTETSPVIAVNNQRAHRLGTVGKPLPNVGVRIADDGEILVRGPSIFKCYWNLPTETAAAFVDGWFKTGDVGYLDSDGFLVITDRKKDLIKTSGGKFIAPQPIENSLKSHVLVAEAAVVGERHKFPAVIIVPNFAALEPWAAENGIHIGSRQTLVTDPRVRALYEGIVEEVNQGLAKFEKLKKVLLLPEEFSIANGLLTPSLKLKRKVLEERYRPNIEALYAEPGAASEPQLATG